MTPAGNRAPRVAVGLSGGVDSAVAAARLLGEGCRVVGVTMSIWDGSFPLPDGGRPGCFGPGEAQDLESAAAVAARLGIPHLRIPLAEAYRREVLGYVRAEYLAGRTPNPCIRCNRILKIGLLPERLRESGVAFDAFATGHYARVDRNEQGRIRLRRAVDAAKDQSYFLSGLSPAQLGLLRLPLGSMTKDEVRREARARGWDDLAARAESQDFVESGDIGGLFEPGESRPGSIRDLDGRILGRHRGIVHYTVGQRKGLGIGGAGDPYYVLRIDAAANEIRVGRREQVFASRLVVEETNWLAPDGPPRRPFRAVVRIRQRHTPAPALLAPRGEDRVEVAFDEPQMAVTPGQAAVFYDGDIVLGGGPIAG